MAACIFCRIIRNEVPCHKVLETERVLAFMDISPLSDGHVLVVPKHHAAMLHELPDADASDLGLAVKRVSHAVQQYLPNTQYNVLQNNGRMAHQFVDHVHFHVIPRPNSDKGLSITAWDSLPTDHPALQKHAQAIQKHIPQ